MKTFQSIDLHMHTTVSDGTDTPLEILRKVKEAGINLFSVTDHESMRGCDEIETHLRAGDPAFLRGAEFNCEDEEGKYHVLGYGYDPTSPAILEVVKESRTRRLGRLQGRLDFLKREFGFELTEEDREKLFSLEHPGKPHIACYMEQYGFAPTKEDAFRLYIDKYPAVGIHVRPEDAIAAITSAGGIPILAHPSSGSGKERIVGADMEKRLLKMMRYGVRGLEAYYSAFSAETRGELLALAEKYDLYVTAGSDYHGTNKTVRLGDTHLDETAPVGLTAFIRDAKVFEK